MPNSPRAGISSWPPYLGVDVTVDGDLSLVLVVDDGVVKGGEGLRALLIGRSLLASIHVAEEHVFMLEQPVRRIQRWFL